jgi:hypothetical protein
MNAIRSNRVLGAVVMVVIGCADRNTSPDGADTSPTASSSSDSGEETDTDASEASTSTDTGDETGFFVPMTEFGSESCYCDPFQQDCAEDEKCVPFSAFGDTWDCVKCVPILGEQPVGESCSYDGLVQSTDDCDAESFCLTPEAEGTCLAFCDGSADNPICADGTTCIIMNQGSITLCMPACSPLLQDCDDGLGCFWLDTGFACMYTAAQVPTGGPCQELNDCAPGNLCAFELPDCAGEPCCVAFCDLDAPACPIMGSECVPFFEVDMAPDGFDDVGVCLSPP